MMRLFELMLTEENQPDMDNMYNTHLGTLRYKPELKKWFDYQGRDETEEIEMFPSSWYKPVVVEKDEVMRILFMTTTMSKESAREASEAIVKFIKNQ